MAATRGPTSPPPRKRARRSALESAFSRAVMGRRWLTPLRLSIFLSRRAGEATPSAPPRVVRGARRPPPPARPGPLWGVGPPPPPAAGAGGGGSPPAASLVGRDGRPG